MNPKNYLLLPDFVAITCMTLVLIRLRGKRAPDGLSLWITGMLLIVAECITRILYTMPLARPVHNAMHVLSLETYLMAGVAFFQSATGRLRFLKHSDQYLGICVVPHAVLLLVYGAGLCTRANMFTLAGTGLAAGLITALLLRRPRVHLLCHAVIWVPSLAAISFGSFRTSAYLSLFFAYIATALAFWRTMPAQRRGRAAVVGAFVLWSLCFLSHPWIAERRHDWIPIVEQVWNLQKFFVLFGLLMSALDEQMLTNEHHALHDALTGLPNRRFFESSVPAALRSAAHARGRLLLFNMDMNGFKQVNDVLGHDAGDQLLREVGRRLQAAVRATDTLARMGGDEFNLLIATEDAPRNGSPAFVDYEERANRIAAGLRRAVTNLPCALEVDGHVHRVKASVSVGWALYPDEATTRDDLASIADKRMYADKRALSEERDGVAVRATTDLWRSEELPEADAADRLRELDTPERTAAVALLPAEYALSAVTF